MLITAIYLQSEMILRVDEFIFNQYACFYLTKFLILFICIDQGKSSTHTTVGAIAKSIEDFAAGR